jgi:hypothetical protein
MILLFFQLFSILLLLSILNQNANGLYVPRVYGHVDPANCLFVTETGEKHQIYRIGNEFMFGRVYLLDEKNAKTLHGHNCEGMSILQNPTHIQDQQIVFHKPTPANLPKGIKFQNVYFLRS